VNTLESKPKLIVDLGGVGHYDNGTVTVNIDPASGADIICDITAGANRLIDHFDIGSVHMFTCIHTLEHLEPRDAIASLRYWKAFLEPIGRLFVVVPDIFRIMQDVVMNELSSDVAISLLYRNSTFSYPVPWSTHKWGWTRFTLARDLAQAGYKVIEPQRNFGVPDTWLYDYKGFEFTGMVGQYNVPNLKLVGVKPE
jgi:hypothetical protein